MNYKVGTITFHWATNYGAVLQAFALQKYLMNQGYDTEIIDYVPLKVSILEKLSLIKNRKFKEIKKERKIEIFRQAELKLSKNRFHNNKALKKITGKYDCVIAGSDQIWNRGFTMNAEGGKNLSYYLDFVGTKCNRVSYAVSFGFNVADDEYIRTVKKEISNFNAISVRENTGLSVLSQLDVEGTVVCDPTLLNEREVYDTLANKSNLRGEKIFSYILHKNQRIAQSVVETTKRILGDSKENNVNEVLSVYDWLKIIRESEIIVTNSFHAVMFALIFNTSFIAISVEDSNMNDRIPTILSKVNLSERFIDSYNEEQIKYLLERRIDWERVNRDINCLKKEGQNFLKEALLRK